MELVHSSDSQVSWTRFLRHCAGLYLANSSQQLLPAFLTDAVFSTLDSVDIDGTFEAKGVEHAKQRLEFVAAEVREPFPAAVKDSGVDTIVMKHFLSGFSDGDADIILKHCKQVLPNDGKILLLQVCTSFLA
jgi:hypothetical protein